MFALIGSVESLLTVKAVDAIDPFKRKSDLNRDLMAVGIGNFILALIGGLPMISEVVRSYANVSYGARTRWSNFFHGAFLLLFAVALADLIHLVPVAALAGVLCVTGYRLAAPKNFQACKEIGNDQLVVFIATILSTLMTDLLTGVGVGVLVQMLCCIFMGAPVRALFSPVKGVNQPSANLTVIRLPVASTFMCLISFKRAIEQISTREVEIDFSEAVLVDHTVMKEVRALERDYAETGKKIILKHLERLTPVSEHHAACRRVVPGVCQGQALVRG
jgi:MFS superfamily sulfate permease-like transporter